MADKTSSSSLSELFTRDFLLIAIINLTMFFGFQMTNVGLPVYVSQLGANAQMAGLVGTLMTITAVIVRIFAGPLLDRFGRKGALVFGSLVMAASIFSYSVFPVVGIILGVRLLQGIGWGLGSTASSTIAADIIPKKRFAEGMGYFAMTNAISSALAPAVSIALVQGPGAEYMIYIAGGCAALAFVMALFQRSKAETADGDRARAGGPAVAAPDASAGPAASANPDVAAPPTASATPAAPQAVPSGLAAIFERRALFPGLLMLLVNIGFGCITSFIALHGAQQGIQHVSIYFVVYAVVTLASRPLIGRLIDLNGYRMASILSALCTAFTLLLIGISDNIFMLSCSGVLAGLGIGTAMSVYQAMAVSAVEPQRRGVATSTYFVAFDTGIAIGSLIGGIMADAFGYVAMYALVGLFPLAACVLSLVFIRDRRA